MAIQSHTITDHTTGWVVTFSSSGIRSKENKCKYNWQGDSKACHRVGCGNPVRINNSSGLCAIHKNHSADLLLQVTSPGGALGSKLPSHVEIIERLIEWANTRNYQLEHFFEELAFNLLGNIPDVTILDAQCTLHHQLPLPSLIQSHMMSVVDKFFPSSNSSSYQVLRTKAGDFPVRILATILAGLVLCEEANRGDRWFCRNIMLQEEKTSQLGGAMPLVYFAARRFNWGVEMQSVLFRILR